MLSLLVGDVFLLQTRDKRNPLVYAIFSTSRSSPLPSTLHIPSGAPLAPSCLSPLSPTSSVFQGSAVCVYTMADIRRAFLGPFAHKEGPNYQWVSYQGRVPYPRPGMVRGVEMSQLVPLVGCHYMGWGQWGVRPCLACVVSLKCPSKTFGTFGSTKDFPDEVIQFARHHPLMYNPVLPHGQRPLFLQATVPYTFTRIAVDRVTAADGHYDVLFIGTGM